MNNKKIILIASQGTNVGKSYLSQTLKNSYKNTQILSFADPLKIQCDKALKKNFPELELTFTEYYSDRVIKDSALRLLSPKSKSKYKNMTLREFLIRVSNSTKKFNGGDCFIKKSVSSCLDSKANLLIFDDFRLPFEYEFLEKEFGLENILTLYISKEDVPKDPSNSYEGLLKSFNFDITFEYLKDYNNSQELLKLIDDKVRTK